MSVRSRCLGVWLGLFGVLLPGALALAQSGAEVSRERPRLLVLTAVKQPGLVTVEQLRELTAGNGAAATTAGLLRAAPTDGPESIPNVGLRHLLFPEEPLPVEQALAAMDALAARPPDAGSEDFLHLALGYDWLHDAEGFSEARRQAVRAALDSGIDATLADFGDSGSADIFAHRAWSRVRGALAATIALAGDTPDAAERFDAVLGLWSAHLGPALCYLHGSWHEGIGDALLGTARAAAELELLVRAATGRPSRVCERGTAELARFAAFHLLPDRTWLSHGDVAPDQLFPSARYRPVFDTLAVLGDGLAGPGLGAALSAELATAGSGYEPRDLWRALLFASVPAPAAEPLPSGPAVVRFGENTLEQFVFRTGSDPDSTVLSFRAGDWFSPANHLAQGGFSLFHKGWLAVDSGVFDGHGTAHREAYSARSVAHNVLTVRREGAVFPSLVPGTPVVNDGGQRQVAIRNGERTPPSRVLGDYVSRRDSGFHFDTADVTRTFSDGALTVVEASLARAYDHPAGAGEAGLRLDGYVRRIAWLGGRTVLVQDALRLVKPEDEVRWLLHTPVAPSRSGEDWLVENGGVMAVRTLLPERSAAEIIGGPGHAFWVDGQNVPPADGVTLPASAGTHRLEIRPLDKSGAHHFLHALRIGDSRAEVADVRDIEVQTSPGLVMVRTGQELLVLPEGTETLVEGGYRLVSAGPLRHRVFGARANVRYLVTHDGLELARLETDRAGALIFTSEKGGVFRFQPAREAGPARPAPPFIEEPCFDCPTDFRDGMDPCGCTCSSTPGAAIASWALLAVGLLGMRRSSRRKSGGGARNVRRNAGETGGGRRRESQ